MSRNEAKAVVTRYIEQVWNRADLKAFDEMTTPGFEYFLGGQAAMGREAMKAFLQAVRVAFPDWSVKIVSLVADGGEIAARWEGFVTHDGPFRGIPPTGKRISVCGINMYAVEDGKIKREWEQMDSLGMLQQLGVLPGS